VDPSARDLALMYLPILLRDASTVVQREAMKSMGNIGHASFIPLLVNHLEGSELTLEARKALSEFGTSSVRLLTSYYHSGGLSDISLRHLLKAIAEMRTQEAADALLFMLEAEEQPSPRRRIIKSLNRLRSKTKDKRISFPEPRIQSEIRRELRLYYELFAVRQPVGHQKECQLLCRAIGEKMQLILDSIFRLLGLIYNRKDMQSTYLGLNSPVRENRAKALELLDNTLDSEGHELLFPIVDSGNPEKLKKLALSEFGIKIESTEAAKVRLLDYPDPWLNSCTLYGITSESSSELKHRIFALQEHTHPVISETARLVAGRLNAAF
jgi:HEAT repeat protein